MSKLGRIIVKVQPRRGPRFRSPHPWWCVARYSAVVRAAVVEAIVRRTLSGCPCRAIRAEFR